ncbi:hypothetical protein Tco_1546684 [Tanacetum coccineum]
MAEFSYAFKDSLLLTPLCYDDIHDVTPRVSALAGCDRLVSKPLVIENSLIPLSHESFDVIVGIDWLSKRKVVIVCHEKVVRIPLAGDEILWVHGEHLSTTSAKSQYRLAPSEMQELSEQLRELQDKVGDALSRKERVKSRRVRGMILAAQSEGRSKQEKPYSQKIYMFRSTDGKKENETFKEWNSGDDQLRLRWMIYLVVLADVVESVRDAIGFEYCLASLSEWTNIQYASILKLLYGRNVGPLVLLRAEIRDSSLTRLELVQEMTDKVVLVKEKPKSTRDCQKSDVDYRRKPLEFEGKLAPRYVGMFEILGRIGLVAYRLRLPEELNSMHDTFHVV